MNRRKFLQHSALLAGVPLLSSSALGAGVSLLNNAMSFRVGKKRPNFVFILLDDVGWKDPGYMGSTYYETPNIDKLASEGLMFTNAYACGSNCAPSRAGFLTGQYSPRHGVITVDPSTRGLSADRRLIPVVNDATLNPEHVTFAEALKVAGYVSASIGKWHMGNPSAGLGPVEQGFDINIAGDSAASPLHYYPPYSLPNCSEPAGGRYITDRLTDEAIAFIGNNKANPFFLYLPYFDVHQPLEAKPDLKAYYETPGKLADRTTKPDHNNSTYAAMIQSVDQCIGRVMKKIEELGLDENTIVFLFSDNGGVGGITDMYPLRGAKGMFYEGGIREPLVVRWKGKVKPGTVCDVPVISIDFFPTFLELAGVKKPDGKILDGQSIVSLLQGGTQLSREAIFWHFPAYLEVTLNCASGARKDCPTQPESSVPFRSRPVSVIRKGDWKLLLFLEEWILDCGENTASPNLNNAVELYNLASDLGEQNNLAARNTAKRNELLSDLLNWRISVGIHTGEMIANPGYEPPVPGC